MPSSRRIPPVLVLLDVATVLLLFNGVGWLRGVININDWIVLPLLVPFILLTTSFYLIDGYKPQTDMIGLDYTSEHLIATVAALIGTILLTFVVIPSGYPLQQSRAVITFSFLAAMPVTLAYRRAIATRSLRNREGRNLVFVGDDATCATFAEECKRMGFKQPVVNASAATSPAVSLAPFRSVLNLLEDDKLDVEAIVLREGNRDFSPDLSQRLVGLYFRGIPTYTLELFHQVYWRKIPLYRLNQTWLFQEGFQIAREPVFERLKRLSDIGLSSFALIFGSPLFLLIAAAIWMEDRQSVLFRQVRIGRNRVPFNLFKFRTMRVHATGSAYTGSDDKRITRIGKFLRSSRLDELPQMLNVLRGEMSLIGPRAEWDRLVHDYEARIPCYHFRHLVKPGITGWAQVNYPYGASLEDTERKLEYDLYYIRHFSFVLDASIVLKTIHIMLFGKGAR